MIFDIPKDYFLDEVRDGFFVPSMIKKSWAASIVDYKVLEEICDKQGYNLFFMYGSLIAVIRHAGSIPWDDDIDSMMLHDEFQKLKKYLDDGGAPEHYWMNDYSIMGNGNLVRKWMDNDDAVKTADRWEESFGFPFINNIDVMMLDNLPDGEEAMQYYSDVVDLLQYLKDFADVIETGSEEYNKEEFSYSLDLLERVLKVKYDPNSKEKLSVWIWRMLDEFTAKYRFGVGSYVASVSHYLTNGNGRFPKSFFQDFLEAPYEFTTVKVPVGYDGVLRDFFGNYMTPRLEWDGHIYPFYRSLESALLDKYDVGLLRYHYTEEGVRRVLDEKEEIYRYKEHVQSAKELFAEAHGFICDALIGLSSGDDALLEQLLGVLGSCQEFAVNLGNIAENRLLLKDDIDRCVHRFEDYCECVFGIYQRLSENGDIDFASDIEQIRAGFLDFERFIDEESVRVLPEKKKVLFLCWRAEHWHSLHTIWEAATLDRDTEVTVIAVPYFIKNANGEVSKDEMIVESDGYPESVLLTPYNRYDMQKEHPDVVIYQCPYDEYSDAMTVHPYYYSSNLRKYAEKLVFIPPFTLREISDKDEKSRYTVGCFICNPGVVLADVIFVQSEDMKRAYESILDKMISRDVKYLKEEWIPDRESVSPKDYENSDKEADELFDYTPDDYRVEELINWNRKIIACGSALSDWDERSRIVIKCENDDLIFDKTGKQVEDGIYDKCITVPDEWIVKMKKEDGSFRKVLLYTISAGVAFEYGSKVFEKASAIIEMLDNSYHDDLVMLFFADRNYRQALRKNNPSAWSACQKFKEKVRSGRHIFDDSLDEKKAAILCDACFGDGSSVMNLCREYGRPVMIQSPDLIVE